MFLKDHTRSTGFFEPATHLSSLRRDVLTGLSEAEKAILADSQKGRQAEATEREAFGGVGLGC